MSLKSSLRNAAPASVVRWYEKLRLELPVRLRDLPLDLRDRIRRPVNPLPPARLRGHVGRTSSREEYVLAGTGGLTQILSAFQAHHDPDRAYPRWLDFGCGPARMSRHLRASGSCDSFVGVDVDRDAIEWNRCHIMGGQFVHIAPMPPMPIPSQCVDVIFAASVFTHLDEGPQLVWLEELHRVLAPGGLLVASTHSPGLAHTRPDLSAAQLARLEAEGFAFAPGSGAFNDDTTFHSRAYLEARWTGLFALRGFREKGLFDYQDLSVWERSGARSQAPAPGIV